MLFHFFHFVCRFKYTATLMHDLLNMTLNPFFYLSTLCENVFDNL